MKKQEIPNRMETFGYIFNKDTPLRYEKTIHNAICTKKNYLKTLNRNYHVKMPLIKTHHMKELKYNLSRNNLKFSQKFGSEFRNLINNLRDERHVTKIETVPNVKTRNIWSQGRPHRGGGRRPP